MAEVQAERQRVLELHLEARTQQEIADEIQADRRSVGRHLEAIERTWRRTAVDYGTAKGRQLAQIRKMLREAWAAWHASKLDKETSNQIKHEGSDKGPQLTANLRKEGQTGNPAYLNAIQWCLEQEAKLLGLSASPAWILDREAELLAEQSGLNADEVRREARQIYEDSKVQTASSA
jgi:hypothetical protein